MTGNGSAHAPGSYLFYRFDSARGNKAPYPAAGFPSRLWRPGALDLLPRGATWHPFLTLWALHQLKMFSGRDYGVFVIHDGELLVHQSSILPKYFRFPFMGQRDLHIGDIWTHPDYRGRGLATFALRQIVAINHAPSRSFWYVVREDNAPSMRAGERAGFVRVGRGVRTSRLGCRALGAFVMEDRC